MSIFTILLYDFALLAGTAYLVGWQSWSPWWFIATGLFFVIFETKKSK